MAIRRFRVAEASMVPTLRPGDEIAATDSRRPEVGDLTVVEHPARPGFWLVKRRVVPPHEIRESAMWVLSDNAAATKADSRTFGSVPKAGAFTVIRALDEQTFPDALRFLAAEEPSFEHALDRFGMPRFWRRRPGFASLVLLILEQQVSLESGAAMYRRLETAAGSITPESISSLGEERMRSIGVTRQKAGYLSLLAHEVIDGIIDLSDLADLPETEARDLLLTIKGVGPWTADAYLLAALRHIDTFPVGDRALQVGTREVLDLGEIPDQETLQVVAAPWKPFRAAAARLIWHVYLTARGRSEPPDPTPVHDTPRGA